MSVIAVAIIGSAVIGVAGDAIINNQNRIADERAATAAKAEQQKVLDAQAAQAATSKFNTDTLATETDNQRQARSAQKRIGAGRAGTILGSASPSATPLNPATPGSIGGTLLGGSTAAPGQTSKTFLGT